MKYIPLSTLIFSSVLLFGFDIQAVDLTKEGQKKSALPYTIAKDGKKIYKDIGKTIQELNGQVVKPKDVKIIYPIGSNKTHEPTPQSGKKKNTEEQKEDITSVFADANVTEVHKLEDINNENKQIKLNNKAKKITPVNLEK